ncbi:MAG: hypothetical protein ACPG5U_10900 [Planktomarina sp.]
MTPHHLTKHKRTGDKPRAKVASPVAAAPVGLIALLVLAIALIDGVF